MSRYDQDNVDHLDLPDPNPTVANYYIENSTFIDREAYMRMSDPPKVCAKEVQHKETKITSYFVLCNNRSRIFDPRVTDPRYRTRNYWKFRKVTRSTFELYIKFLKNKYNSLLLQAERSM
jgi:hypothetical protein